MTPESTPESNPAKGQSCTEQPTPGQPHPGRPNPGRPHPGRPQSQHGGMIPNLLLNIVIPTVIMTKFSGEDDLGPMLGIVVALAFPIAFGIWDFAKTRKANFFSILGVISVLLTGTMSLLKFPPEYIAIKEAAIPAIFGIVTLVSLRTRWPLVKTLLMNEQIMQVDRVHEALAQHGTEKAFEGKLKNANYMIAGSFFLSSVLNYVLARIVVVSEPGTVAYTEELGKMTALSFPVIALPSTAVLMAALWYLFSQIRKLTHLDMDDIFNLPE